MSTILKVSTLMISTLLLQACASDSAGSNPTPENWWRVTPVDISEVDSSSQGAPAPTPAPVVIDNSVLPVFRYFNMFGFNLSAGRQSSLNPALAYPNGSDGQIYSVFVQEYSHRLAIYSCSMGQGSYFTSQDVNCEGQVKIGRLGFLERQATADAPRAVYRCVGLRGYGHMDTKNSAECGTNGMRVEGILGYAP